MKYVKYVGLAHMRRITADEWSRAGVRDMETMVWGPENGFMIPLENFSEDVQRQFIEPDRGFIIVGQDEAPRPVDPTLTADMAHEGAKIARITDEQRRGDVDNAGGNPDNAPTGPDASATTSGASTRASGPAGGPPGGSTRTSGV